MEDVRDDATQVDVAEEEDQEAGSQREHDDRASVGSHRGLSASYYTALHVVVVSSMRRPVRCALPPEDCVPLASPVLQTTIVNRYPDRQGKVRDIYEFGDLLLIVASDRISAFDYVLGTGIPDKGKVLTQISQFWFDRTRATCPNHLRSTDPSAYPEPARSAADLLRGRSMLVIRTEPLPIECVARGYLSSGHDLNIAEREAAQLVGAAVLERVRDLTLRLYGEGGAHAESRGILVADTKFEFGLLPDDGRAPVERIVLIDEVLTPDSSRFWPRDTYHPGGPQASFDKQFVRDYLEQIRWNKQPPVPTLPDEVVARTREKYLEAFRRLTGRELQ